MSILGGPTTWNRRAYRLYRCVNSILVVFSIDFTTTLILGVKGAVVASLNGLKLNRVETMRLAVFGRWRIRIDKVFKVASTSKGSLKTQQKNLSVISSAASQGESGLLFTCSHSLGRLAFCLIIQRPQPQPDRHRVPGDSAVPYCARYRGGPRAATISQGWLNFNYSEVSYSWLGVYA